MFTNNIQSTYDISGTNDAQAYCLSTDVKKTGAPFENGHKLVEMDTSKIYFYDEENERWLPFN